MKKNSKNILLFLLIIIILYGIYSIYSYTFVSPYLVPSSIAKILLNSNKVDLVLDVRTNVERQTLGYYPNSVHIQSSELKEKMPQSYPNKEALIIVYCNTGQRARKATDILHSMGYNNAIYIASGHKSIM